MTDEVINEQVVSNQPEVTTPAPQVTAQAETTVHDFRAMLSEDLASDPSLKDFKDANSLAKSYKSLQSMMGSRIPIPTEDASPEVRKEFLSKIEQIPGVTYIPMDATTEDMNKVYDKLGRPTDPTKYNVSLPSDLEDTTGAVPQFKQLAHTAGLTNDQAQKVMDFYVNSLVKPHIVEFEQTKQSGMQTLKDKWGSDYDVRLQGAKNAKDVYVKRYPQAMQQLLGSTVANNPAFVEMLSDLALTLQESDVVQGESKLKYGMTREEALQRIQEVKENPSHPYYTAPDHERQQHVDRLAKLYEVANSQ